MATLRHLLQDCPTAKHILPPIRPTRNRPNPNYDETGPQHRPLLPRPPVHFPLGQADGVGVGPSTLNAPGIDAGSGLFGVRPKKAQYANKARYRNLFAKAGDYICAYNGTTRTRQDCITTPSLYLFADPDDPQQRYIDSWDPARGVLSYGGYLNETFEDEDINCTIKFKPHQAHPGVYAKRDIYLHEELFTGYGKPQWIYTIFFFPTHLSPQTLMAVRRRYKLPTNITSDMVSLIHPNDIPPTQNPNPPTTSSTQPNPMPTDPLTDSPTRPNTIATPNPHCPNLEKPTLLNPPPSLDFPYGTQEGVGIGQSTMLGAGQGLYGVKPLTDSPHLFAKKGQFICIYATHAHQISANTAKTSKSRYMWSTNTHNKFNPHALYYDASNAPHYGKFLNDLWDPQANNCELRRNPATGRVEVYATRDISLNAELGLAYDAPFWYQPNNGLTTRQQAVQVKTYYQRSKLPPWHSRPPQSPPHNPPPPSPLTPTQTQPHPPLPPRQP